MFKSLVKILGGSDERVIRKMQPDIEEINSLETGFSRLSDDELGAMSDEFKQRIESGVDLDELAHEAFAVVREAAKRTLGQRHFDVQLIGGLVLHHGQIAEMRTGEGKTLVATLPAYLNALTGLGVHVVTVNDYLARRDAQWMGSVYHKLGLTVGVLQHESAYIYDPSPINPDIGMEQLSRVGRSEAYGADITYGTNNEFGFDYLRDNMVIDKSQRVQRELNHAIVDEVDNILIDEARTPLIISGPGEKPPSEYQKFSKLVPNLKPEIDYTIEEKHKAVSLTAEGITNIESSLRLENLYAPSNFETVHLIENALKAKAIFTKDQEYVVRNGEVIIVDEFTGRLMQGRRYSDGLHQALEAKEGVRIQRESITYATITLQNYFRLYSKLSGMTGTAETEAEEFHKIYKLEVVAIPTNKPMVRIDHPDLVFKDQNAKLKAVVTEIESRHKSGQPVLVGTTDIDKSEELSAILRRKGLPHEILNAKQHEREALVVAQAGRPGAITVATNMAGRGTDIVLGGNSESLELEEEQWVGDHQTVIDQGGLFILGTERHEARRIDNQLRGRAGRQGDPGESRFYVALDDELMRRFGGDRIASVMEWAGLDENTPIENKMIGRAIEGAQVKVEAYHFDIRKHLVEYDDVVNTHRDVIYGEREKVLAETDLKSNIQSMIEVELSRIVSEYTSDNVRENWNVDSLIQELLAIMPPHQDFSDPDKILDLDPRDFESGLIDYSGELYQVMETNITEGVMRQAERQIILQVTDTAWVQHLTSMESLRQGIGLHAYGQRDPLVMYKREGHQRFQDLRQRIQNDIVRSIFHIGAGPARNGQNIKAKKPAKNETIISKVGRQKETVSASSNKTGRNEICPCGSGKKFKKCHGV
ncbi:MAG: preprotein translocase subunit SecA [Chloroflexota bacterium]|nr:preprotein translocase subunit SecA [Chloroflexota bacterium]